MIIGGEREGGEGGGGRGSRYYNDVTPRVTVNASKEGHILKRARWRARRRQGDRQLPSSGAPAKLAMDEMELPAAGGQKHWHYSALWELSAPPWQRIPKSKRQSFHVGSELYFFFIFHVILIVLPFLPSSPFPCPSPQRSFSSSAFRSRFGDPYVYLLCARVGPQTPLPCAQKSSSFPRQKKLLWF